MKLNKWCTALNMREFTLTWCPFSRLRSYQSCYDGISNKCVGMASPTFVLQWHSEHSCIMILPAMAVV